VISDLQYRLRALFRRKSMEADLDEELRAHFERQVEKYVKSGLTRQKATRRVRLEFGGLDQVKEECRDARGVNFIETLVQDIRFGLRMLAKNPGFTAVAVLTLALGIGATTTVFSVLEGAVLHPFPYRDTEHLVEVIARDLKSGREYWEWFPVQDFVEFRNHNTVFDQVIGTASSGSGCLMTGVDTPAQLHCLQATGNLFEVLGVSPLIGRTFTSADFVSGAPRVAVFGYRPWQREFGGDAKIIGRTIILNGQPTTVIGVMPPRFTWEWSDVWIPETFTRGEEASQRVSVRAVGHLRPGVSVRQAAAEVGVLFKGFALRNPKTHHEGEEFGAELLTEHAVGHDTRRTFFILLGAVALLFGIGCLNVANLLLARATTRETEIAVRASLGAGRMRLVRQLMVESLLLGVAGALVGCLCAWVGVKAAVGNLPPMGIPGEAVIRINGRVLLFTGLATMVATLLFGLAPAMHAARKDFQVPLRASGHGAGTSRRQGRLRDLLVVSEVTLSLVLMTGAGVLLRSFLAVRYADSGYDPHNVLIASVRLPESHYKTSEQRNRFRLEVLSRLRAMPGVVSAALGWLPWMGGLEPVEIQGKLSAETLNAQVNPVGDGYFATLRVPLLGGRDISEDDVHQARHVAVINQLFARRFLAGEDPLGRQVTVKGIANPPYSVKSPSFEIVGVVADFQNNGPLDPAQPSVYVPCSIVGGGGSFLIRTATAPGLLMNLLRREVAALDKELPVDVGSLEKVLNEGFFGEPRFVTTLMLTFASLGLALVLVGVYSVLSYSVTRRTHEIGIRMALGAEAAEVRWMVIKSGLRWLLAGIGLGVPASVGLAKVLANRIWGLKSADPLTLAAVAVLLTAVGLAACYFPARRATKVDPMVALRYE